MATAPSPRKSCSTRGGRCRSGRWQDGGGGQLGRPGGQRGLQEEVQAMLSLGGMSSLGGNETTGPLFLEPVPLATVSITTGLCVSQTVSSRWPLAPGEAHQRSLASGSSALCCAHPEV